MDPAQLARLLDEPPLAVEVLSGWGLRDPARGHEVLRELAEQALPLDLLAALCGHIAQVLPTLRDPDETLAAFGRFLLAARSPLVLAALCEREPAALALLLSALALGRRWRKLLLHDPEAFDLLHQASRQQPAPDDLRGEVLAEAAVFTDEKAAAAAQARLAARHALRIAHAECVAGRPLEWAQAQRTALAEALIAAALDVALHRAQELRPLPAPAAAASRAVLLALGRLGAGELDDAAPLELLFVYDVALPDASAWRSLPEHFDRAARILERLLAEIWPEAAIRLLPLPGSSLPAVAHAADDVLLGLDSFGRTWHRQAMLKARPIAGDAELGCLLIDRLQAWLYRRYLTPADETGIQALKRRIQRRGELHTDAWRDLEAGRGGLRDIQSAIEFLQLLAGGDQPIVRERGTLAALAGLESAGALLPDERRTLEEGYRLLAACANRLRAMSDPPQAELPPDGPVRSELAMQLGLDSAAALDARVKTCLDQNWRVIGKLLESALLEEPPLSREVELLLDPEPPAEEVEAALAPYGFARPESALAALQELAREQIPFLSTRRCRHLLTLILPRLLAAVAATGRPDQALDNLARVSHSLGGKGVLWELLGTSPPALQLYVRLCAASPYLSNLLLTNPGMIDELVDSLQRDRLPQRAELEAAADELLRSAGDPLAVLHDFKAARHLQVGVREMLSREDIDRTQATLSDVAEICLARIARRELERLEEKHGPPVMGPGPLEGAPCGLALVGLGRLGGREPNYHSELDLLVLYEGEGTTRPRGRSQRDRTANNHFFTQLAQRIIKEAGALTPKGRLYAVDVPLRPIGVGGALALSLGDLVQHFASGAAPLWQWLALCQARPVQGAEAFCLLVQQTIRELVVHRPRRDADRAEVLRYRHERERSAAADNVKRAPGGTLDVETLVQWLQLEHAARAPRVLQSNTLAALAALAEAGALAPDTAATLDEAYRFLRRVESGLRLLDTAARHDLPAEPEALAQLALLLGHSNPERLREQCLATMHEIRGIFLRVLEA